MKIHLHRMYWILLTARLTVTLDPNLTPDLTNYNIAVNSNIVSSATVRQGTVTGADGTVHNTVIFSGGGISSGLREIRLSIRLLAGSADPV